MASRTVLIDEFEPIFDDNRVMTDLASGEQGDAFKVVSAGRTFWVFDPRVRPATPRDTYTLFDSERELLDHHAALAGPAPGPGPR